MNKILKINRCFDCPFIVLTTSKRYKTMDFKTKYACGKMLLELEFKYLVSIDGKTEIPVWCPLEEYDR